ncbi:rRNA maturation RNase YbeY [Rubinisphaera margarita]|uniref:rRNA maturation RNase YbeY n=1 Tax=Rubinisphaera margarita TaxID=2909586 RepID=UPI001EE8C720|nr:rRNA maturation RNase YbeY [Rubinisphaera margarita]MCG6154262.1 rRNA maturation RNase YbeY [Rubinisphaera margarita]
MEQLHIEIIDEQVFAAVDHDQLQRAGRVALDFLGIEQAELSVVLLDNPSIHEWNRNTLQHDFPTDVITFPLSEPGELLEGELLISVEMAASMAAEMGWSMQNECTLYLVHGILHLVGYDDLNPADQLQMRARERELLEHLDITPGPNDDRWS